MFDMQNMLQRENVQIIESVPTWKTAIFYAIDPLVKSGFAQPCYAENIIANAEQYGPYFILCPDLALLHARPEQGAIKTQLGITIIRQGVTFKPGTLPCRVLITLVATDDDAHLDVIRILAKMLERPEYIKDLATAKDSQQVYERFMSAVNNS